jgi:hypothetical protein
LFQDESDKRNEQVFRAQQLQFENERRIRQEFFSFEFCRDIAPVTVAHNLFLQEEADKRTSESKKIAEACAFCFSEREIRHADFGM